MLLLARHLGIGITPKPINLIERCQFNHSLFKKL